MDKPEFIKKLEENGSCYSVMEFYTFETEIYKFFDEKESIQRVYERANIDSKGLARWIELIYQTQHPFFIHIQNNSVLSPKWSMNIYYPSPEKLNELIIFIRQILKKLKDDTTDDGTTTR